MLGVVSLRFAPTAPYRAESRERSTRADVQAIVAIGARLGVVRIVAICLATAVLGLAACGGGSEQSEPSSGFGVGYPVGEARAVALEIARRAQERLKETKSHDPNGAPTFSARDLPSLLKDPPDALGEELRRDAPVSLSRSVAEVWAHGDDVSKYHAARWGRRLREAGFQRAGRADFEPADGRFSVIVEAIVLGDAASAGEGVAVLQGVHSDYVSNNGLSSSPVPAPGLGAPAWGMHSNQELVAAFGFRVGNVAFSVVLWS